MAKSVLLPDKEINPATRVNSGNRQAIAMFFLIMALFFFGLVIFAIVAKFSLPVTKPTLLGELSAFPKSEQPYELTEQHAILVNTDNQLLVLSSRPPHLVFRGCPIHWDAERQLFFEPCGGSTFSLEGYYLSGPSPRSMDSYPFWVEDGQILADLTQTIPGGPVGRGEGTPLPYWMDEDLDLSYEWTGGHYFPTDQDILTLTVAMEDRVNAFRIEGWVQVEDDTGMPTPHVCRQAASCVFQAGPLPAGKYEFNGRAWMDSRGGPIGMAKTIIVIPADHRGK